MSYDEYPQQSGEAQELPPLAFNFENMSLDFVRKLHGVIFDAGKAALRSKDDAEEERIEKVEQAFDRDFGNLPYRNIDKARELIVPLAGSEHLEDRYAAAGGALAKLLKRECELGTEDLTEQTDLMIKLVNDGGDRMNDVDELARMTAYTALTEGWWRDDVAARVSHEWQER